MTTQVHLDVTSAEPVSALLKDGVQIQIRPLTGADREQVRALHAGLSPESRYLRFFTIDPGMADRAAWQLCRPPGPDHAALGAWLHGELIGVAGYEPTEEDGVADLAVVVADWMRHRGVGTLLLEHLGSLARSRGVRCFRADTLARNEAMLRVLADTGMSVRRTDRADLVEVEIPLEQSEEYLEAVGRRERLATVESLWPLLRPASAVVVGASRRRRSVGNALLRRLHAAAAFPVYAVNPRAGRELEGVRCVPSVAELPEPPDLAVLTVPAHIVPQAAEECGRRGARALVVISSGLTEPQARRLLEACHRYGMRLVGPNCIGVADPGAGLDATFTPRDPRPGTAGVVVQSGGVGIALQDHLSRLGIGISSFASVGDKLDVSANDMLMWWESDGVTRLGVLHLESFGNPRKFARTARRVGRKMPLLTVIAGRSQAGRRAAASHTAAVATPEVTRRALFAQAGIVATDDLGELVDAAALLAHQPYPRGSKVAIVTNAGGAGVLAADACTERGLIVAELSASTRRRLRQLLPEGASLDNPVDATAAVPPRAFRAALAAVAADEGVDAVMAVAVPTAVGRPAAVAGCGGKPLVAVTLGQAETVTVNREGVPSYAYPENAAAALAHAASYGRRRSRPQGTEPVFTDLDRERADRIVGGFLKRCPDGGWLPPDQAMELLEAYRLPMAPWRWARTEEEAVAAAARKLGGSVALKAHAAGVVHKTEAGALRLGLSGEAEVRRAHRELAERFGDALEGVLVQAMVGERADDGVEVLAGVIQEQIFGPVVVLGLGGVATEVLGDRCARMAPLTDVDAEELIDGLRAAPLLRGHRGRPPADLPALREALLRLSRLAADRPEIAELDLNPLIARPDGVVAVDARIRLVPNRPWDPFLRRLR